MNNEYAINLDGDGGSQNMAGGVQSYHTGTRAIIWQNEDGTWWSCLDGVSADGNLWESDDYGPFDSASEAEDFARDMFNHED